jgi:hypothetical protein
MDSGAGEATGSPVSRSYRIGLRANGAKGAGGGPVLLIEQMGLNGAKGLVSRCNVMIIGVGRGTLSSLRRLGGPDERYVGTVEGCVPTAGWSVGVLRCSGSLFMSSKS